MPTDRLSPLQRDLVRALAQRRMTDAICSHAQATARVSTSFVTADHNFSAFAHLPFPYGGEARATRQSNFRRVQSEKTQGESGVVATQPAPPIRGLWSRNVHGISCAAGGASAV